MTTKQAILVLNSRREFIDTLGPPGLLFFLGLPKESVYFKNERARMRNRRKNGLNSKESLHFWRRNPVELLDLFHKAKTQYRSRMKLVHPDITQGEDVGAITLNRIWFRLKTLYKKHGLIL